MAAAFALGPASSGVKYEVFAKTPQRPAFRSRNNVTSSPHAYHFKCILSFGEGQDEHWLWLRVWPGRNLAAGAFVARVVCVVQRRVVVPWIAECIRSDAFFKNLDLKLHRF